jgi:hypothetical protein
MAELKTKRTRASVGEFVGRLANPDQRRDARALVAVMRRVTKCPPRMWGSSIVGFGAYHYKYDSGREGDWFVTGFSPRKDYLAVYLMAGLHTQRDNLARLGKATTGKSCLYIRRLSDIRLPVLERMIRQSRRELSARGAR